MAPQIRFESSTPPPRAQTLEILLLITMAPSLSAESSSRPSLIGAPGKAFCVKTAPHWLVGSSGTMSVSVIVFGSGASSGTNLKLDVPTRKPLGSAQCADSRCVRYSVLDLKLRSGARTAAALWRSAELRGSIPARERCNQPRTTALRPHRRHLRLLVEVAGCPMTSECPACASHQADRQGQLQQC
jgi:hypothetical protein